MPGLFDPQTYLKGIKKGKSALEKIKSYVSSTPEQKTGVLEKIKSEVTSYTNKGALSRIRGESYGPQRKFLEKPKFDFGGYSRRNQQSQAGGSLFIGGSSNIRPVELPNRSSALNKSIKFNLKDSSFADWEKTPLSKAFGESFNVVNQKIDEFKKNPTISQALGGAIESSVSVVFAPVSAAISEIEKIPIVGSAVKFVFDEVSTGATNWVDYALTPTKYDSPAMADMKQNFLKPLVLNTIILLAFDGINKMVRTTVTKKVNFTDAELKQVIAESKGENVVNPTNMSIKKKQAIYDYSKEVSESLSRDNPLQSLKNKGIIKDNRATSGQIPKRATMAREPVAYVKKLWADIFGESPQPFISKLLESAHPKNLNIITRKFETIYREMQTMGGINGAGIGLKPKPKTFADMKFVYKTGEPPAFPKPDLQPTGEQRMPSVKGKPDIHPETGTPSLVTSTPLPKISQRVTPSSKEVTGRIEPSDKTLRTSDFSKSTQKVLSSNRRNFLKNFGIKFNELSQPIITKYYESVKEKEKVFSNTLADIAKNTAGKGIYRIKKEASLSEKLKQGQKKDKTLGDMNDTLGGSVITEDLDGAIKYSENNYNITNVDDFRQKENQNIWGYKGVHMDYELPNGMVGEIQIHTPQGILQKEYSHIIYDKWRVFIERYKGNNAETILKKIPLNRKAEFLRDVEKSKAIFNGEVKIPQNIIDKVNALDVAKKTETKPTPKKPTSREIIESQALRATEREAIQSRLDDFDTDTIKAFDKIRKLKDSKYASGDMETLRKDYPKEVQQATERYNEATGQDLVDTEAFDEIMGLPSLRDLKDAQKGLTREESATLRRTELTSLRNRIKTAEAKDITDKEKSKRIQDIKSAITDYAKKNLDLHERGKLLATVKNAGVNKVDGKVSLKGMEASMKDFEKAMEYIDTLEELSERRTLKQNISKALRKTKLKNKKGKYTPEIQNILDFVRKTVDLSDKKSIEKIDQNIKDFQDTATPADIALENKLLSLWTGNNKELRELNDMIDEMTKRGKMANELKKFNIQSQNQREVDFIVDRVTGYKGIKKGRETFGKDKSFKTKLKHWLKSLGKQWVLDWHGQLQTLDFNTLAGETQIADNFGTLEQDNKFKKLEFDFVNELNDSIRMIYKIDGKGLFKNIKQWNNFQKKLNELSTIKSLGTFKNLNGVDGELKMSKDEIIKRWMELQDQTLKESIAEGNKYTPEMIEAIEKEMTVEDKEFAEWQFDMYKKQAQLIKPIFNEMNGYDLPTNPNYSPIRREGFNVDETKGFGEFQSEINDRRAITSKSFIARVKNRLPLAKQNSIDVLMRHMKETNYFIAYAKQIRRFNAVFKDPNVREAIDQEFGTGMLVSIGRSIDDLTTNANITARSNKAMDFVRKNFTVGALMAKPAIGIKQFVSTVAYMEKINPKEFIEGIVDFALHPVEAVKILTKESPLIETRGTNMDRDINAALSSNEFKNLKRLPSLQNFMMFSIKFGDKGAIVMGSWALRKARLKAGVPLSEIIKEYENFSSETQQSADISRRTEMQRGNSLEQLFTMFKSSQRQYLQKELNAIKSFFQKDGFSSENIKRVARILLIYHIALPVIFQFISNLGGWDDEDKKEYLRAGILGSVNGLFIAGDVIDGVIRTVMGMRVWDTEVPITSVLDSVKKAIRKLTVDDIELEDYYDALSEFVEVGNTVAIPVKQTKNMIGGLVDIMNKNVSKGMSRVLGFSEYSSKRFNKESDLEKQIKEQNKKRDEFNDNADKLWKEMQGMKTVEEKISFAEEIGGRDKELLAKVKELAQTEGLELTDKDKLIRQLGVSNGERAKYIWKETMKLPPEERLAYATELTKKKLISKDVSKGLQAIAKAGGLKEPKEAVGKEKYLEERGTLGLVIDYAKAFSSDRQNAWKALTTKEKLGIVEGNLVELQRFYGLEFTDKGGSQEVKKRLMEEMDIPWSKSGDYKLEHILPVTAGGGNEDENLVPITNVEWKSYTPLDIALGIAMKQKLITRKEAVKLTTDLKVNKTITKKGFIKALE